MSRTLKAGTIVHLAHSNFPMALKKDAEVMFSGDADDATFVGHLHGHKGNYALNIGSVEGIWNPVTGARMNAECGTCGREIDPSAPDQTTCADCLSAAKLEKLPAEKPKKKAKRSKAAKKSKK